MSSRRQQPSIERLVRIPLFAACTRRQLTRVDSLATTLILDPGYVLQEEGTDTSAFFVILDGAASVAVGDRCLGTLRDGHFFGAIGLLDRGANVVTVTAATRIRVLVFSRTEFRALLEVAPSAAITIMRAHAVQVRVAHGEVVRARVEADAHDKQDTRVSAPGPSLPAPLRTLAL
jgi:CRP-like cAMP-binding protein